jgi:nucleolar protein 58
VTNKPNGVGEEESEEDSNISEPKNPQWQSSIVDNTKAAKKARKEERHEQRLATTEERAKKKAERKAKEAKRAAKEEQRLKESGQELPAELVPAKGEDPDIKRAAFLGMKLEKYKLRKTQGRINFDALGVPTLLSKKDKKKKSKETQAVPEVAGKKRKLEEDTEKPEKKKKKKKSKE